MTIFPFGKYKNDHVNVVFSYYKDYDYLYWWINNIKNYKLPNVIINNIKFLNLETHSFYNVYSDYRFGSPLERHHHFSNIPIIDVFDYTNYYLEYLLTIKNKQHGIVSEN